MKKLFFLLIIISNGVNSFSQNIVFTDLNLKSYLINENSVDTNDDNMPDSKADLNNDGEIQISEALSLTNLSLGKLPDTYHIESIQDISYFNNLEQLTILWLHSLQEISLLGLTNLTNINIGSCDSLTYIDISDLPNIIYQKIEDLIQLEYLNIQNNSFPSGNFSLFYTENIQYACVDNISEEYNEVSLHMAQGLLPAIDCSLSTPDNVFEKELVLFPNPIRDSFEILYPKGNILKTIIYDINGKILLTKVKGFDNININFFESDIYFVKIILENTSIIKKLVKY